MTDQHPITPPPELVQQWADDHFGCANEFQVSGVHRTIATRAAQWGADQELEACCEWLHWQNLATHSELIPSLRTARRPKPPSLKEQALNDFDLLMSELDGSGNYSNCAERIRRALEQLDD